jgi:hypothetical protein
MNALVANLLDMARLQTGEVKLRKDWLPIEEVVGSALKSARPAIARHRVDVALSRDLPLVEIDATLVERVLYNILENAGKYTPEGTTIRISAEVSGNELLVAVADSDPVFEGPGAGDLRQVRSRQPGIVDARRGPRSRDQPRDHRGIAAGSGPRTSPAQARVLPRCRSARRRSRRRRTGRTPAA